MTGCQMLFGLIYLYSFRIFEIVLLFRNLSCFSLLYLGAQLKYYSLSPFHLDFHLHWLVHHHIAVSRHLRSIFLMSILLNFFFCELWADLNYLLFPIFYNNVKIFDLIIKFHKTFPTKICHCYAMLINSRMRLFFEHFYVPYTKKLRQRPYHQVLKMP